MSNPGSFTPSAVPSPLTETQQPREVSRQRRQLRQQSSGDEFQEQVLRTLYMVRVAQQQHGDVLQELCSHKTHSEDDARPSPALIASPFGTSAQLEEFNSSLNENKKECLVKEVAQLAGNEVGAATRTILQYLMTDEVPTEYSWKGQKGKRKFCLLHFPGVIVQAIRRNKKLTSATKDEVEGAIKNWLRHATERVNAKAPR
ncbi:uncharacterized protein LOC135372103 [Ornithodoros turicata]|uniref:uncharacterized protein LOC135372103 n=1 Tax=Ornithodoros turicata TaxID=34597 RepID=UPI003138CE52